jgi:hypothetical protein
MSKTDYGFIVEGAALICPRCADNPLYDGVLERVDGVGYPDGYTCDDCGKTVKKERRTLLSDFERLIQTRTFLFCLGFVYCYIMVRNGWLVIK